MQQWRGRKRISGISGISTRNISKRTSLNTKRTCDDEDDDEDEEDDDDDDDDDDERYRYDQRVKMFKFQSKTLSSTFNCIDLLLKNTCQYSFSNLKNHFKTMLKTHLNAFKNGF